jgi:streptogramin lyase
MHPASSASHKIRQILITALIGGGLISSALADISISGHVIDSNGRLLQQAMVTVEPGPAGTGIAATTVFTDAHGAFTFPAAITNVNADKLPISARVLGFRQVDVSTAVDGSRRNKTADVTIIMERTVNQAGIAPASAWMKDIASPEAKAKLVMNCVGCHQFPAPEVRNYARLVHEVDAADPAEVRKQSWQAMVKYMNFLSAEEFGRGNVNAAPIEANRVYGVTDNDVVSALLARHLQGAMSHLQGYAYGAPLAVNARTSIREYAIDGPNTVREALLIGSPPRLWVADVLSNNVIAVDVASGKQKIFTVPSDIPVGPHTLVKGSDDTLWVAPFFNGIVAHLDIAKEAWRVWPLKTAAGGDTGIHDLSFNYKHELMTDKRGRIWYSDIVNNAVGYFDPATGKADIHRIPEIPGRPGRGAAVYGLAMTMDQKYIWYSQLGIASFGCFNTETMAFETVVSLPMIDAGPRRITINDKDILYVALYGAGQLIEYDTRARKQIGIYDLPDRASAPYSVTWDNVRQVAWIPTSNADVIYRFDPTDKSFSVLPLPREQGFLRMVGVDPETGYLATSYANIAETVQGPRMALLIDPGDDYRDMNKEISAR